MSDQTTIPIEIIEAATVVGYHRVQPGRRVAAIYYDAPRWNIYEVPRWNLGLIGRRVGLKGETWAVCSPLEAFLDAAEAGMVSHRNVQGPMLRDTVATFRARYGYPEVTP